MSEARPAATVVIVRDSSVGPQVLMLRRSRRAGFFPNAWVYPGGRVDPADKQVATIGSVDGIEPEDSHFAVAALRECLEEAGVWLGKGSPAKGLRARLNEREATLLDAPSLIADLSELAWLDWWVTPELEPKRYDTRFFVVKLKGHQNPNISADQVETVESCWITPQNALAKHRAKDDFFLAPPTYRTLQELQDFPSADAMWAYANERPVRPIMPKIQLGDPVRIFLPGDPENPSPDPVQGATRLTLVDGAWVEG